MTQAGEAGTNRPGRSQHPNRGVTAMRQLSYKLGTGIGIALLPLAALAAQEDELERIFRAGVYASILFVILVAIGAYFMKSRDKRRTPLDSIFEKREAVHSVGPDTPVIECVRKMTAEKIGAMIVLEGEKLVGIFTERDAVR